MIDNKLIDSIGSHFTEEMISILIEEVSKVKDLTNNILNMEGKFPDFISKMVMRNKTSELGQLFNCVYFLKIGFSLGYEKCKEDIDIQELEKLV